MSIKKLIETQKIEQTLREWSGADAIVWMYHATHRRMVIRVESLKGVDALFIGAVGCKYFHGGFCWNNCNLSIEIDSSKNLNLVDKINNFTLSCSEIYLFLGSSYDFDVSFENFIGGGEPD